MGHRLSKIYTRTGDSGTTGLGDGSRTDKDSLRVEACGTVDELNSIIGLLTSHKLPDDLARELIEIEHERIEHCLDRLNADLEPLKEFILPGGSAAAAVCHLARTVCRRAERRVVSLARKEDINEACLCYLNRLSDLLFVMARSLNHASGRPDVLWQRERNY
jgi:cob(I)alamin adenosyltransferase